MGVDTEVIIVGAGPYGLSIAAHLKAKGVAFRIFGQPMQAWITTMPRGMSLKSEGFASTLYDPGHSFTLEKYCAEQGLDYGDLGVPVPLETFIAYGLAFQKRFVPELDERSVESIEEATDGFTVHLEDGEEITSNRVVLAVGISRFASLPDDLAELPKEFISHSSEHSDLDRFSGRDVAVLGAGASALDIALLLHKNGARPVIIARQPTIYFQDKVSLPRPLADRVRAPLSCIGQGWMYRLFTDLPLAFHALPQSLRHREVSTTLGPSGGWSIKEQIVGKIPFILNSRIVSAEVVDGRLHLHVAGPGSTTQRIDVDHVIAATGYRLNIHRLSLLSDSLKSKIDTAAQTPVLSNNFESSVPGLYFVGVLAANSFGPMLRFACGAEFTARRISRHLARTSPSNQSSVR